MQQNFHHYFQQNKRSIKHLLTLAHCWKRINAPGRYPAQIGWLAACGLMIVGCSVSAKAQKPASSGLVGQLLNVRGTVKIEHDGVTTRSQARTCDPLREGDMVTVSPGASAQALLSSTGTRYALASGSKIQVQSGLKSLSGTPPMQMPKLGRTLAMNRPGRAGATLVRGLAGDGPSHPSPIGLIPAEPVVLHWSGITEGSLMVRIQDTDSAKNVYTGTVPAGSQELKIPAGLLKPGVWYSWSVQDMPADVSPRVCKSLFRLPLKTDAARLAEIERDAAEARQADKDDPTPDILLAQGYADLGLFTKAREAYEAALKLRPDDEGIKKAFDDLNKVLNP